MATWAPSSAPRYLRTYQRKTTIVLFVLIAINLNAVKCESASTIRCLENQKFYRDPDRPLHKTWTPSECSKYFLCLDGEVFEFKCSDGLLFDINRQICDFKINVDNCDLTAETPVPPPLLEEANCAENNLGCADGKCLPAKYFCDGSVDCLDGSDEGYCDSNNDVYAATTCSSNKACHLPNCFCSADGTAIPGDLDPADVPQMILLTFDDAINYDNYDLYVKTVFNDEITNPNGCPIRGSFFVSHQYNNYHQTQTLWNMNHEIAVHSITHRGPENWWSDNATIEDWFDEMVGEANILKRFSKIRLEQIQGMRAPFLKVGWNKQFLMMKEFGFVYDSSIIAPYSDAPLWPYTLDFKIPHNCTANQNCPTRSYSGIWEIVINQMMVNGNKCETIQSCSSNLSEDEIYNVLIHNFKRHYLTNRAPFGLHFHASWFRRSENLSAFQRFIDDMLNQPDVWFVTNSQAIAWMRNPTPIHELDNFEPWQCMNKFVKAEIACKTPNVCNVYSRVFQENRLLYTCTECPEKYPWIRNEFGSE